ncbi:Oxidoreductase, FAD-binding domain-containing protein, partial [Cynara cardunculus var. scolymus]
MLVSLAPIAAAPPRRCRTTPSSPLSPLVAVATAPPRRSSNQLVKRTQLSHNVAKFRFALPKPTAVLGLPIGQHISCRGKDSQGEEVIKPYTPTTLDADVGYFELVIK